MSNRDLFGTLVHPPATGGASASYTIALSVAAHALAIVVLVIVPLMAADVLPSPPSMLVFVGAPVEPPLPPPPPAPQTATAATKQPATVTSDPNSAPVSAPSDIFPEQPAAPVGAVIEGVTAEAGVFGVTGSLSEQPVDAPPPPPVRTVHQGGQIQAPAKLRNVYPNYPPIAQAARVEGTVIIEATIGPDGHVEGARILRSIPLLDEAALEAVRQWEFSPTRLNGLPVAVVMTVTVNFKLQ